MFAMSNWTDGEEQYAKMTFLIPPQQFSVHGEYEDLLGKGAFGSVYRCYHETHGQVAVKMFDLRGSRSYVDGVVSAVSEEMELMLLLQKSPQVVDVFGLTRVRYCMLGLVMEYLPRGSLFDLIQKRKDERVPWPLMLRILQETASGLEYLHKSRFDERVTHNDLKPENILLDINFHAKLCDFGGSNLAAFTSQKGKSSARPNSKSDVYTINYVAPEYLTDGPKIRTRAMDVYSYGMIVYFVLKKSPPFWKWDSSTITVYARNGPKPAIELQEILNSAGPERDKEIIQLLADTIENCGQRMPQKRPQISSVSEIFRGKLEEIEHDVISLAVEELCAVLPVCEESNKSKRVDLETKCTGEFVPKLGIPFDDEETTPLLASYETSSENIKATNSIMYRALEGAKVEVIEHAAPKVGREASLIKATCSNLGKPVSAKNVAVIDISHAGLDLQKGAKLFVKTKLRLAVCAVEQTFTAD